MTNSVLSLESASFFDFGDKKPLTFRIVQSVNGQFFGIQLLYLMCFLTDNQFDNSGNSCNSFCHRSPQNLHYAQTAIGVLAHPPNV